MARHHNNKYKKRNQETTFVVREECELMDFLMKVMDGISRTKVKKLLTYDSVHVNDRALGSLLKYVREADFMPTALCRKSK